MLSKLNKDNRGFTIIEVLIVLAIAGLIMLIVFLAIPALQRNQRNNARNSDGSRISAAVSECLANKNGQTTACDADAVNGLAGDRSQLEDDPVITTDNTATGSTTEAVIQYGTKCDDTSEAVDTTATANTRDFTVRYQIESASATVNRCVGSQSN